MFKISRLTDYGVIILRLLASKNHHSIVAYSARDLSVEAGLPLPTVSKLLKILAKSNLIEAKRGATGGYVFANDPKRVSLLNLIEVFEGPTALTSCVKDSANECCISKHCPQKDVWHGVNKKIMALLSEISLFELIGSKTNFLSLKPRESRANV